MRIEVSVTQSRSRKLATLWLTLAVAGAAAWVPTVLQARTMGAGPGTMGMAFSFFLAMWVAMMAAMMLPALGPSAAAGVAAENRSAGIPRATAFGAGFLVPWAVYGGLAFAALRLSGHLAENSPGVARWLGVGIFAVAGIYELSPWKRRAMEHCRSHRRSDAAGCLVGDVAEGMREGTVCVGCCWALMTILIAVGVMNLGAMAGLASVIFAEKVFPRPRIIAAVAGIALLGLAIASAVHPALLAGLQPVMTDMPMTDMPMGGMNMGGM